MQLLNLRLGCNDLERARAFYDATFGALGVAASATPKEYPIIMYKLPDGLNFVVGPARDGKPATHTNGGTILFAADSDEEGHWYGSHVFRVNYMHDTGVSLPPIV